MVLRRKNKNYAPVVDCSCRKPIYVSCITQEGIDTMKQQVENINVQAINDYHHDIMAHLQAYCDICPAASSFIHLGATSNYINDNCELILVKKSFKILHKKLLCLMEIFLLFMQMFQHICKKHS